MEIRIYCAHDELIEIEKVIPNPRNPNKHPDRQIELLAKIIAVQGWRAPITVSNRSGFVVRGHGRLLAARKLGLEKVPVDRQDYASEAEEWADLIADNRIAELAEVDNDLLKDLLQEVDTGNFDMDLTGFTGDELEGLMTEVQEPMEVREDDFDAAEEAAKIENPITQRGDIWLLGRHRLMCGDSTAAADMEKLMNGKQAHMIFTDPPYNVDYEGGNGLKIMNDKMDGDAFLQFLTDAFASMFASTAPGGAIYVCHSDSERLNFDRALKDAGWLIKQCIIWAKNVFVLGRQDYQWKHEPILYGWKPGAAHRWFGGRKQSTVIEDQWLTIKEDGDGALITVSNGIQSVALKVPGYQVVFQGDDTLTTLWRFEKPLRNADHPTMKPVGIPARAIQNSSQPGEIVLDPFGGSGSTLIAAEQTNHTAYLMELDPVYCDVIVKRWEQFTGNKAERIPA